MTQDRTRLGFDRRVDRAWLDAAAEAALASTDPAARRDAIWAALEGRVPGDNPHTARGKTLTVLNRVWCAVPPPVAPLRDDAARLWSTASEDERLALHWALVIATHPFVAELATQLGRTLALQETAGLAQLHRKVAASWGERATVQRAVPRVLASMVEWTALTPGPTRGTYASCPRRALSGPVSLLLIEAVLRSSGTRSSTLRGLLQHPSLFPFDLHVTPRDIRAKSRMHLSQPTFGEIRVDLAAAA